MPSFLTEDVDSPDPSRRSDSGPRLRNLNVEDPSVFTLDFDEAAVADIDRLIGLMKDAPKREDVIYTALQILGLAINYDLEIEGSKGYRTKRVHGLWK